MRMHSVAILCAVLMAGALAAPATGQTTASSSPGQDETTLSGTVISSSRNTMVVRTDSGSYQLFVFDRDAIKPRTIPPASVVRVISMPGTEPGVRIASYVSVSGVPSAQAKKPSGVPSAQAKEPSEPVPVSIRRLERDIERQSRRYGLGFRTGAAVDPELLLVGAHARLGPFFNPNVSFRPNVEFAFGEVTKLFAINLEGVYRLPLALRGGRWSAYVGAGPNFSFIHQDFEEAAAGEGIDFGDFDFQSGLNILAGLEFRSGMFMEAKTTVWADPHLRLMIGFSF